MAQEVAQVKQPNNLISNLCNMHLEIENKKRSFRSLGIARINFWPRGLGISYSKLINGNPITIYLIENFSELVVTDEAAFQKVVETAIK